MERQATTQRETRPQRGRAVWPQRIKWGAVQARAWNVSPGGKSRLMARYLVFTESGARHLVDEEAMTVMRVRDVPAPLTWESLYDDLRRDGEPSACTDCPDARCSDCPG